MDIKELQKLVEIINSDSTGMRVRTDDLMVTGYFTLEELLNICNKYAEFKNSEETVCPNCDGEGFSGKGTTEVLPCLSCFGSGVNPLQKDK